MKQNDRNLTFMPSSPMEGSERELEQLLPAAYRLHFPQELEKRFQSFYYHNSRFIIRALIIGFIFGYAGFSVADIWSLPQTYRFAWLVRYLIICPTFAIVLYLSFQAKFQRRMELSLGLAHLIGGLGLVAIAAMSHPEEPGHRFYFLGLVFVILGTHFSRLRFLNATIISIVITIVYLLTSLYIQRILQVHQGNFFLIGNSFFLGFMNLAGMFVSYTMELSARQDFLQRRAIAYEQRKSENLLLNILPYKIAALLKNQHQTIAQEYEDVSILFADIVNFTPLSEQLSPTELVGLLDELFSQFDRLVEKYDLEKIKTIGDCYMVASGVPTPRSDHAEALVELALEMRNSIQQFVTQYGYDVNLRMGIHSGSVVAGVIGRKKFLYDLWGDTVNTASRMESHSIPGCIQISRQTYELLSARFVCQSQGKIPIKGKGDMEVWHVLRHSH
ncbi:MAG: adenylate/guanylate cyclase domain-containing protein [Synechococcales bacterium]|nr:adenylate/guanylate cyclase domain-containing protein [Synechococcales bacterium]